MTISSEAFSKMLPLKIVEPECDLQNIDIAMFGAVPAPSAHVLDMRLALSLLLLVLAFFATLQSHASDVALVGAMIYLSPS
jgi:hypothetical protein